MEVGTSIHPNSITNTNDFLDLDVRYIVELLGSEGLAASDYEAFDAALKWIDLSLVSYMDVETLIFPFRERMPRCSGYYQSKSMVGWTHDIFLMITVSRISELG